MSKERIDVLRKKMTAANLDGLIVSHLDHVRYLTGFTGSHGLLVLTTAQNQFFTDFRYGDQAKKQVKGARINIVNGLAVGQLKNFPKLDSANAVYGYNGEYLTLGQKRQLSENLPKSILVEASNLFADLGWVKDKTEIASITSAVEIADEAFMRVLGLLKPGVRESEIQAELEYQMMMLGSEKPAFETIIASGYRSALPHGVASHKKLRANEFVTFDFGATVNGYVSDMTRTVVIGKATPRQKKIYDIVLRAQKAGVKKVKAGVAAKEVDKAARTIIERAGFGKEFGHGTGHGIGFYIHVGPRLASNSEDTLQVNNVVTVEPGIYISGWGGVRIEDDVVVTARGGRVLNAAPRNLLEL